jgi:hypothetical protein
VSPYAPNREDQEEICRFAQEMHTTGVPENRPKIELHVF